MQNLDQDLKTAFHEALQGEHWQQRQCIEKVFTDDASFWHIAHIAEGKSDIAGVYHLWAANNVKIGIEFLRIVPDPQRKVVVVDILEHCHIWWNPLFTFTGGPIVYLHTILELRHTPEGMKISHQYDHTMWLESLLYHNLPHQIGDFFKHKYRPFIGKVYATCGNWIYDIMHSTYVKTVVARTCSLNLHRKRASLYSHSCLLNGGHIGARIGLHPDSYEEDLKRVISLGFHGTFDERRKLAKQMYTADAEFVHPLAIVKGPRQISGLFQLWCTVNREVNVEITRIVPSADRNLVVIDITQHFTPFWWPPSALIQPPTLWLYVILHLVDSPQGGKLIRRHEDHALWVESVLFSHLNPLGALYAAYIRPVNGALFGFLGRQLVNLWALWHHLMLALDKLWRQDLRPTVNSWTNGKIN